MAARRASRCPPYRDVEIDFVYEDGEPVTLTTVDADRHGTFTVDVTLPAGLDAGSARIEARNTDANRAHLAIEP